MRLPEEPSAVMTAAVSLKEACESSASEELVSGLRPEKSCGVELEMFIPKKPCADKHKHT